MLIYFLSRFIEDECCQMTSSISK